MINAVPLVELLPGTSRHFPDCGFRSAPLAWRCHTWFAPLLQLQSRTFVPSAVPLPATSMHLPSARSVPAASAVHFWPALPLQSQSWMGVPSAELEPLTFTHLFARPTI